VRRNKADITSHEAEADVTTALAAAVVLLLLVTGGCVLSGQVLEFNVA